MVLSKNCIEQAKKKDFESRFCKYDSMLWCEFLGIREKKLKKKEISRLIYVVWSDIKENGGPPVEYEKNGMLFCRNIRKSDLMKWTTEEIVERITESSNIAEKEYRDFAESIYLSTKKTCKL